MTEPKSKDSSHGLQVWEGSSAFVEQGRHWSSALIWLSTALFGGIVVWSFTARLDQTITVRGRLQPSGSVQEIDSPSSGVVRQVFVKEGDLVSAGDPLMTVEALGLASRRKALEDTIRLLRLQAASLQAIIASGGDPQRLGPMPLLPIVKDPDLASKQKAALNQTLQLRVQLQQLDTRIRSRQESVRLQTKISNDVRPLYESGGLARNTYLNQLDQVQELTAEIASFRIVPLTRTT